MTYRVSVRLGWARMLGVAAMLLILLGLVGGMSYVALVAKYARLESATIELLHDAASARVVLKYQPLSAGEITVRSIASGRAAEVLDHVPADDVGGNRELELPWAGLQPGDRVEVHFRGGWWTTSRALSVPAEVPNGATLADVGNTRESAENLPPSPSQAGKEEQPPLNHRASNGPAEPPASNTNITATQGSPGSVAAAQAIAKLGLYGARTASNREEWLVEYGGNAESERAVAAGLVWLARHQADDGHWGPDCVGPGPSSRCEQNHPCDRPGSHYEAALNEANRRGGFVYPPDPSGRYEAALTGLAVLAFQAGGHHYFNGRQYSDRVAHALSWLEKRQGPNGELVGSLCRVGPNPGDPVNYEARYMYVTVHRPHLRQRWAD